MLEQSDGDEGHGEGLGRVLAATAEPTWLSRGFLMYYLAESQPGNQLSRWQQVGAETLAPGSAKRVAQLRSAPGALLSCGHSC